MGATATTLGLVEVQRPAYAEDELVDGLMVLAVDISRLINDVEANLPCEGYHSAISDPEIVEAICSGLIGSIALAYVEWWSCPHQIGHRAG